MFDLMIEASAQRRLLRPLWRTNYVLYSEGMTPAELAVLLQQIGADKRADNPFDHLVVRRMTECDHKELSALLGVDPVLVKPSEGDGTAGASIPVSRFRIKRPPNSRRHWRGRAGGSAKAGRAYHAGDAV